MKTPQPEEPQLPTGELSTLAPFTAWLETRAHSPATVRNYQSDVRVFNRWFAQTRGQTLTPDQLTSTDVRAYRQHLLQVERRMASTVNRRLSALSAYSQWAQEQGLMEGNPTTQVSMVTVQPQAPRWLYKTEQAALLRELEIRVRAAHTPRQRFRSTRNQTLTLFMLHTCLRLQEVCALVETDLRLEKRSGYVQVQEGKGSKQRTVPLNTQVRQELTRWEKLRRPQLPHAGEGHNPLFITYQGHPLQSRSIQKILAKAGHKAGVALTPHVLRHTFAKNLVRAGVSLEKIAALMGHANLNTTRIYTIPDQHDLEQAVERLA